MRKNVLALTGASYLSMLFLGIGSSIIGAAARNIDLSPFQIGLFLTIQNVGFMIAVWFSGALADTYEKPRILVVGSLILAFSFFGFYQSEVFWINLIIMMFIGIGVGTYEGVSDAMLLDLHSKRQNLHININHFFVTLGSIVITVYLIYLQMNWRDSLVQSAVVVLILALVYGLNRLKNKKTQSEAYLQRLRILSKERTIVALFIATVLVVGVELGTTGLLTTYLMDMREFTQTTSKLGLITFLAGIASGRVLVGFFSREDQLIQYVLGLLGFATVAFFILFYVNAGHYSYITIYIAGLSMSALVPLIITLAGQLFPNMAGTVIGSIKVAMPIGGILLPFLMSLLDKVTSFQVALLLFPLALALAFGFLFFTFRRNRTLDVPTS